MIKNILLTIFILLLSSSIYSKTKTYYLKVVVDKKIIIHHYTDLDYVQQVINIYYPEYHFNMSKEFKESPFFHLRTFTKEIYIEEVSIKKSGKYKRDRQSRKYKKI